MGIYTDHIHTTSISGKQKLLQCNNKQQMPTASVSTQKPIHVNENTFPHRCNMTMKRWFKWSPKEREKLA